MNKALKKKWVKALRSGDYKQVRNALRDYAYDEEGEAEYQGYCCLGVLCDISGKGRWKKDNTFLYEFSDEQKKKWKLRSKRISLTTVLEADPVEDIYRSTAFEDYYSPKDSDELAIKGYTFQGVLYDLGLPKEQADHLMNMNDEGKSFNEIADWIEENV